MCSLAQESVSSSVQTFLSSTMLTNQLITRTEFNQEINDTLARFQLKTPIAFARTLDLTRLLIHDNAIMEFPLSNWITLQDEQLQDQNLAFFSQSNVFIVQESNQSCSCATSSTCISPSIIFKDDGTVNYTIPGFAYGCYLFQSVLLSSLSCLYSLTCIAELRQYLDLRAGVLEEYHATTGYPIQLNASATRFNVSAIPSRRWPMRCSSNHGQATSPTKNTSTAVHRRLVPTPFTIDSMAWRCSQRFWVCLVDYRLLFVSLCHVRSDCLARFELAFVLSPLSNCAFH